MECYPPENCWLPNPAATGAVKGGPEVSRKQQEVNEFLFWDFQSSSPVPGFRVNDCCELYESPAEEENETVQAVEALYFSRNSGVLGDSYPVPTYSETNDCGCANLVELGQLRAALEDHNSIASLIKQENLLRSEEDEEAVAEHSLALAAAAPCSYPHENNKIFMKEFGAKLENDWVIVGKVQHQENYDVSQPSPASQQQQQQQQQQQLKPALKQQLHRPSPLRRPSNTPPITLTDGPTPKNADDADQTCDNFKHLWEKDPNLKTPTIGLPSSEEGASPSISKSVSFKDKKSLQCLIYVEPDSQPADATEVMKLEQDDKHTFDNFDRLWEKDPRFIGEHSCQDIRNRIMHELEESSDRSETEVFELSDSDMIQKHIVHVVNTTTSSASAPVSAEGDHRCRSNVVYDPVAKKDRRFTFEFEYELTNRNEEEGTADSTIRNALVSIRCDVQVQVVLKVEPMQDPERKFLYSFTHYVGVLSDFKLETEASLLHKSTVEVVNSCPGEHQDSQVQLTHHKVKHSLVILHRWALATTPKHQPGLLQRRMSASSSQSRAHQEFRLPQDEEHQDDVEGEVTAVGDKVSVRPKRKSLHRSNSK